MCDTPVLAAAFINDEAQKLVNKAYAKPQKRIRRNKLKHLLLTNKVAIRDFSADKTALDKHSTSNTADDLLPNLSATCLLSSVLSDHKATKKQLKECFDKSVVDALGLLNTLNTTGKLQQQSQDLQSVRKDELACRTKTAELFANLMLANLDRITPQDLVEFDEHAALLSDFTSDNTLRWLQKARACKIPSLKAYVLQPQNFLTRRIKVCYIKTKPVSRTGDIFETENGQRVSVDRIILVHPEHEGPVFFARPNMFTLTQPPL